MVQGSWQRRAVEAPLFIFVVGRKEGRASSATMVDTEVANLAESPRYRREGFAPYG